MTEALLLSQFSELGSFATKCCLETVECWNQALAPDTGAAHVRCVLEPVL